ncbi:MAG: hypothetical protein FWG04_04060 [Desulfovibrionaceae bacterium]|nr:hypothetical protein [Desulfovibrionaceae bacterium]
MGRILFIRVSAETYDEKEVIRAWPKLYALVWPDAGADSSDSPGKITRDLLPDSQRGVLQLMDTFVEHVHFGNMSVAARNALAGPAKVLERLRAELNEALGNRDAQTASKLTNAIEDALDSAERAVREI